MTTDFEIVIYVSVELNTTQIAQLTLPKLLPLVGALMSHTGGVVSGGDVRQLPIKQ